MSTIDRIDPDVAIVRKLTLAADVLHPDPDREPDPDATVTLPAYMVASLLRDTAGKYVALSELFPGEAEDRAQAAPTDPAIQIADTVLDGMVR